MKHFDRQMMESYYLDSYSPANLVITAAGNLMHKMEVRVVADLVKLAERAGVGSTHGT